MHRECDGRSGLVGEDYGSMSKTLELRPRQPVRGEGGKVEHRWHDYFVLSNAINSIAKGKDFVKAAPFMGVAAKLTLAAEEVGLDEGKLPEIRIEVSNQEVRLLWRELENLKPEQFGNGQTPPPVGPLYLMLQDFANQLGYELPNSEDDDENKE